MNDATDFAECQNCLCLAARRKAQRLTRAYDARLRPHGLTIHQFSMLTTLILAGPLPMSALAERLGVDRTTLTRNVTLSEDKGLVAVKPGSDARERVVNITRAGLEMAEKALPAWQRAQAEAQAAA